MTLKFLGRGSAFNVKEGNTSAYIKEDNTLLLIDCGSNIFERIIKHNLLEDVENVYVAITHRHPDHIGSLGDLIFYCYYKLGIKVNLLDTDSGIYDLLLLNGITDEKYERFCGDIDLLGLQIISNYASHCGIYKDVYGYVSDKSYVFDCRVDLFDCYSFIIKSENKNIFYSGDCEYVDWHDSDIIYNDEFYIDCCIADYEENVHYNIDKLNKDILKAGIDKSKIHCMHFDCDEAISRAKELGFKVVECIE